EALARVADVHIPTFPGSPTVAQLAAATSNEFFLSWCATVYASRSAEDAMDEIVGLQRRIFGELEEGDSLAYVLYRLESRHIDMNVLKVDLPGRVMVMPVKRVAGQWLLLLNEDFGRSGGVSRLLPAGRRFRMGTLKRETRVAPGPSPAGGARPA